MCDFADIEHEIKDILSDIFRCNYETITLQSRLRQDLGLDDRDRDELFMLAQIRFQATLDSDELLKIQTVGDLIKYIQQYISD